MNSQELRALQEAYSQVYQLDEISQKTATRAYAQSATGEFEGADSDRDIKRTDRLRGHIERKFGKKAGEDADRHADSETFGRKDPRTGKRQPKPESRFQNANKYRTRSDGKMHGQDQNKLKSKLKRRIGEEYDLYDVVLSHLLDEGYADSYEAAEAIMVNMSEDWRESILEEVEQLDEISDKKVIAARNELAKRTNRSVSALSRRDSFIQDTNREGRMNAKIQARNQRTGSNVEPTFIRRHQ